MKLKVFFLSFLIYIFLISSSPLLAGLIARTTIKTPQGNVCIENLRPNTEVCSYNFKKQAFSSVTLKQVILSIVPYTYVITTNHGAIQTSADQLLFELKRQGFIKAQNLQPGDYLLTDKLEALECQSIDKLYNQAEVYSLHLSEPHLFFASNSNAHVLMHNDAGTAAGTILILEKVIEAAPLPAKIAAGAGLVLLMYGPKLIKYFKKKKKERPDNHYFHDADQDQKQPESNDIAKNDTETSERKIQKVLVGSKPGRKTKGKTKQYEKPVKEFNGANTDFDNMELTDVEEIPYGRMGKLSDGRTVNVRSTSSYQSPTLEIFDEKTKKRIKIRYIN